MPPGPMQDKALAYGLYGAVVCRAVFVGLGAVALAEFRGVLLVFAGILLATSAKILLGGEEDEDDDPSKNAIVRWVNSQSLVPATDAFDEEDPSRFFTIDSQGIRTSNTALSGGRVPGTVRRRVRGRLRAGGLWGLGRPLHRLHVEHVRYSGVAGVVRRARARGAGARVPRDGRGRGPGLRRFEARGGLLLGYEVSTEASLAVIFLVLGAGVAASVLAPSEEGGGDARESPSWVLFAHHPPRLRGGDVALDHLRLAFHSIHRGVRVGVARLPERAAVETDEIIPSRDDAAATEPSGSPPLVLAFARAEGFSAPPTRADQFAVVDDRGATFVAGLTGARRRLRRRNPFPGRARRWLAAQRLALDAETPDHF